MASDGNRKVRETERIKVVASDLPADLPERAMQVVSQYSVPLFLGDKLAGSGTFIRCGSIHGILTAHHVVHNPLDSSRIFDFKAGSTQRLVLGIADFAHRSVMEMGLLRCVDVAGPDDEYSGPDLAVIIIPDTNPQLGEIKARKCFYDISRRREERLAESLENDGFWRVAGNPFSIEGLEGPSHGFDSVIDSVGIIATTSVTARSERGEFDFLHLAVDRSNITDLNENLGGMSGGGVWKLPLVKKRDEPPSKVQFGDEVLAGVAFYQTAMCNDACEIRCHAGKSVYNKVYEKLVAWSQAMDGVNA